ncbi:hypothetical protein B0H14DRAFT_1470632 [Mycena olivaceomarginata]|nr:hypothetical protein B0H14DRAFT_1470632 [Mycena olivaceomarginata]
MVRNIDARYRMHPGAASPPRIRHNKGHAAGAGASAKPLIVTHILQLLVSFPHLLRTVLYHRCVRASFTRTPALTLTSPSPARPLTPIALHVRRRLALLQRLSHQQQCGERPRTLAVLRPRCCCEGAKASAHPGPSRGMGGVFRGRRGSPLLPSSCSAQPRPRLMEEMQLKRPRRRCGRCSWDGQWCRWWMSSRYLRGSRLRLRRARARSPPPEIAAAWALLQAPVKERAKKGETKWCLKVVDVL